VTTGSLYDKIGARVPAIVERLLENYRVEQLTRMPEVAKFMYEGEGWKLQQKSPELRARFTQQAWNRAFCEILEKPP